MELQLVSISENTYVKSYDNVIGYEALRSVQKSNSDYIMNAYFGSKDKVMNIYPETELPEGYDPTQRPWYKDAVERKGQTFWTDAYEDAFTGNTIITVARAVVNDGGEVVGVVGMDVSLEILAAQSDTVKIGKGGYMFIVDNNGIILAHRNKEEIGSETKKVEGFWDNLENKVTGSFEHAHNGNDQFLTFATNEKTGWKIIAAVDKKELLADTNVMRSSIFIGIAIAVVLAVVAEEVRKLSEESSKSASEIRSIIEDIQNMTKKAVSSVERTKEAVKEQTKAVKETDIVFGQISQSIQGLSSEIESIQQNSRSMTSLKDEVVRVVENIAASSEETSASTQEVSAATEEQVASMDELSNQIHNLKELSDSLQDEMRKFRL